jgi:hypothetical protein
VCAQDELASQGSKFEVPGSKLGSARSLGESLADASGWYEEGSGLPYLYCDLREKPGQNLEDFFKPEM